MTTEELLKEFRGRYKVLELELKTFKDSLERGETSRYVSLAYTELESSRHWLGEALGACGVKAEYKT